ncbi:MAG: RluA family pseudouridine synthase [Pseudomonadota bacterium]
MAERTAVARMTISADEAGQRLDNYVARHFRHLPRSVIYRLIRRGEVRVNGGRRQAKARLAAGDEVRLPPVSAPDPRHTPAAGAGLVRGLADRVLFESPHLLVLDKPSGLAVHGGSGVNLGVIEVLRQARSDRFLELVHRLDRDTSGCLAIARSRSALRLLQQAFRDRTVRKRYRVLVRGCWPDARTTVTAPLERYVTASGERRVRVSPAGQASRTDFERITLGDGYTELVAHLHTGRTHQIRVHAASHGHPVLGDDKYGRVEDQERWSAQGLNQLALHAERLRLPDPAGGLIDVSAPLPARFARLGALAAAGTATEQGSEPRR